MSEEGGQNLNEVVTGSRTAPSNTTTPLPIDVISSKRTTQQLFEKALQYKIPSFLTVQTHNDATSLLDPYDESGTK
jgi:iron complex outermembrane receptor protein